MVALAVHLIGFPSRVILETWDTRGFQRNCAGEFNSYLLLINFHVVFTRN